MTPLPFDIQQRIEDWEMADPKEVNWQKWHYSRWYREQGKRSIG